MSLFGDVIMQYRRVTTKMNIYAWDAWCWPHQDSKSCKYFLLWRRRQVKHGSILAIKSAAICLLIHPWHFCGVQWIPYTIFGLCSCRYPPPCTIWCCTDGVHNVFAPKLYILSINHKWSFLVPFQLATPKFEFFPVGQPPRMYILIKF